MSDSDDITIIANAIEEDETLVINYTDDDFHTKYNFCFASLLIRSVALIFQRIQPLVALDQYQ